VPHAESRTSSPLLIVIISLALACGGEEEPATSQDVLSSCQAYSRAACQAFAGCIPITSDQLAACIVQAESDCQPELGPEWCWDLQRDAYEDCIDDVEEASCGSICDRGTCQYTCRWSCPTQPPA
jgi:hypothetical protein